MSTAEIRSRFGGTWTSACRQFPISSQGAIGDLADLLAECLDVEQVQYNEGPSAVSFLLDLSPLGFAGMDYNVMVVSRPPFDDEEARQQAQFLSEQKHAADSLGFAFHVYLTTTQVPRNRHVPNSVDAVFLDGLDLERILTEQIPKMALAAIIRRQIPIQRMCPFSTSIEASGAMFRGRKWELALLVEALDRSVAVTGARRIGKTSLMKRAYSILRTRLPEGKNRVFYFNCLSWTTFWHACWMLAHRIDPKSEARVEMAERNIWYMLERNSHHGAKPLILFFDEVDGLIDFDESNGWRFFNLLAAAKDAGFIRFAVGGYRSISRLVLGQTGPRSAKGYTGQRIATPLLYSLEYLELGPLTRAETTALLSDPLHGVEMDFNIEPATIERVWKNSIGNPFMVQFFGQRLFQLGAARNPPQILFDDVETIEHAPELRDFLETHFLENTLENGLPSISERACALILAHSDESEWSEVEFLDRCVKHTVPLGLDEMRATHHAVKNLYHAHILSDNSGKYSFTFPLMKQILRDVYPNLTRTLELLCRSVS